MDECDLGDLVLIFCLFMFSHSIYATMYLILNLICKLSTRTYCVNHNMSTGIYVHETTLSTT